MEITTAVPHIALYDGQARFLWISHTHPPLTIAEVIGKKAWTWSREPTVVRHAFSAALLDGEPQFFSSTMDTARGLVRWSSWFFPVGVGNVAAASIGTATSIVESPRGRELQVLRMLADGRTTTQIARSLHIKANTIYTYVARLKSRTQQTTTAGVVKFATTAGWV